MNARLRSTSLWLRLIAGLVSVSILAIAAASIMLYLKFKATNSQFRERTLQNQARIISKVLRRSGAGEPLQLPDLSEGFRDGLGKFAIVSDAGELVAASPGVTEPLAPYNPGSEKEYFELSAHGRERPFYGISIPGTFGNKAVRIEVAFVAGDVIFDSVLEEFLKDVAWIWGPFVALLLAVNLVVARLGLSPLREAAAKAETIGAGDVTTRIPEKALPREVLTLVRSVNSAFDRLQEALQAQQRFVADAAHELRTPVAVLKSHMAVLPRFAGREALQEEIATMQRLVEQLLDSARLDGFAVRPDDRADLREVACAVAAQLAPLAIANRRAVAVEGPEQPVVVNGVGDFLQRAVRNLVENALEHTPPETTVTLTLLPPATLLVHDHGPGVPPDAREAIFTRFWQGRQKRSGAGLGMDIVARTVAAHGGSITVSDTEAGGALFRLTLRPAISSAGPASEQSNDARNTSNLLLASSSHGTAA